MSAIVTGFVLALLIPVRVSIDLLPRHVTKRVQLLDQQAPTRLVRQSDLCSALIDDDVEMVNEVDDTRCP